MVNSLNIEVYPFKLTFFRLKEIHMNWIIEILCELMEGNNNNKKNDK
jgi:hypothetical protein